MSCPSGAQDPGLWSPWTRAPRRSPVSSVLVGPEAKEDLRSHKCFGLAENSLDIDTEAGSRCRERRRGSSLGGLQAPGTFGSRPRASRGASSRPSLAPPQEPRLGPFGRRRAGWRARCDGPGGPRRPGGGSRGPSRPGRLFLPDFVRVPPAASELSRPRARYRGVPGLGAGRPGEGQAYEIGKK